MTNQIIRTAFLGALSLSVAGMASAATTIFFEDFEDGNADGWTGGSYSDMNGSAPDNVDSPTQTRSMVAPFDGSSFGYQMQTVMFDRDTNTSWAGTQITNSGNFIPGSAFAGSSPSDVTMGFKYAVTADPGVIGTVRFELREIGGVNATNAISAPVVDIAGGINTISFDLDENTVGGFSAFDVTKNYQIYVQIQQNWAINGSTRNIDLTVDDFSIVTTIPEPSRALLGFLGAGLLVFRRRR